MSHFVTVYVCMCVRGVSKTSRKFVQKLRELNKSKHMYQNLNKCVDQYFHDLNFLNLAQNHIGQYKAIQDNNNPYWSTHDHSETYQTMLFPIEHFGPYQTVRDNTGLQGHTRQCRTINDHTIPYKAKQGYTRSYETKRNPSGPYGTKRDNIGLCGSMWELHRTVWERTSPYRIIQYPMEPNKTI